MENLIEGLITEWEFIEKKRKIYSQLKEEMINSISTDEISSIHEILLSRGSTIFNYEELIKDIILSDFDRYISYELTEIHDIDKKDKLNSIFKKYGLDPKRYEFLSKIKENDDSRNEIPF